MPFCGDCRNFYPYVQEDDEFKAFLVAAYHDHDCGVRMMLDFDGMLYDYTFEGDILYERQRDGSKKAISTFDSYPAPIKEGQLDEPEPKPVVPAGAKSFLWAEWRRRWPHYGAHFEKEGRPEYMKEYEAYKRREDWRAGNLNYTYKPPYDIVDRARWPNLWRFTVKLHFLPNSHKDTKWVNGVEPLPAKGAP